ncbi:MAG: hypothetical protein ABIH34_03765 [Nanoarchaeota archaeon]
MNEYLEEAQTEFKRVDHLIFVSLKYTRTVDVFQNIFERISTCFDAAMGGFLQQLKDQGKIDEIPGAPRARGELLKKHFADDGEMQKYLDLFLFVRRLMKSTYTRRNEFRRHVTMTATLEGGQIFEVNIDRMHEYHTTLKNFIEYITPLLPE